MFLQASVCPQRGGGVPKCLLGYHPPEQKPPRADTPQEQTPKRSRYPPRSRHSPEQTHRSRHPPGADSPKSILLPLAAKPPWEQTPPPLQERQPLLRMVRILMECILVRICDAFIVLNFRIFPSGLTTSFSQCNS